jgi:hypothetical protein
MKIFPRERNARRSISSDSFRIAFLASRSATKCEETGGMHARLTSARTLKIRDTPYSSDGSDSMHVEFANLARSG